MSADSPSLSLPADSSLRLVVLCAEWCGTCRGYREVMEAVARQFPRWQASWIDIEDQSELVDELDVETFPTVLLFQEPSGVGGAERLLFFGPMLPHAGTLARQVEQAEAELAGAPQGPAAVLPAELQVLADWLRTPR